MNDAINIDEQRRYIDKTFTILCIDDESVNLKILASIFKDHYQVIVSKNAAQGFAKALECSPDLILLDVVMPGESGFELIQKFKSHAALQAIPVIFITGLHNVEDEEKGLTLGASDYIQKPFNAGIVRARVNTHLEIIRQRKLLEKLAHIDSLTELPNRRSWDIDSLHYWKKASSQNHRMVFGIIDIDHFKKFNDHYGHQEGDIVLRKVSNTIKRTLFTYNGNIYRCGGEEFYFYMLYENKSDVEIGLNHIVESVLSLQIDHPCKEHAPYLSISLGAISIQPSKAILLNEVMKSADELLYQVKKTSRNAAKHEEFTAPASLLS